MQNLDVHRSYFLCPNTLRLSETLTFKRRRERKVMVPRQRLRDAKRCKAAEAKERKWWKEGTDSKKISIDPNTFSKSKQVNSDELFPINSKRWVKEWSKHRILMNFAQLSQKNLNQIWSPTLTSGLLVPHKGFQNLSVTAPGAATTYDPKPWGLEHAPASSTVMEKNGSRTSRKCSTFGSYSGYLKPAETSWWIQLMLGYVGICMKHQNTSNIIRLFASLLGLPVEHQGCLRLPPIAVGPKHQRGFLQIDSALVCHGVSKEIQSVLVIQDDIGTQLWDIPTWTGKPGKTRAARMYPGQWSKHPLNSVKRGCMRMLTTMLNKVIVGHGSSPMSQTPHFRSAE